MPSMPRRRRVSIVHLPVRWLAVGARAARRRGLASSLAERDGAVAERRAKARGKCRARPEAELARDPLDLVLGVDEQRLRRADAQVRELVAKRGAYLAEMPLQRTRADAEP